MILLSLASIGETAGLALFVNDDCQEDIQFPSSSKLSEILWDELQQVLARHSLAVSDITAFACVRGPGSYTSLRVGLAAINGMAWALGRPVVGFCVDDLREEPQASLAYRCGMTALSFLCEHPHPHYTDPVMPYYGAEFQLGARSSA